MPIHHRQLSGSTLLSKELMENFHDLIQSLKQLVPYAKIAEATFPSHYFPFKKIKRKHVGLVMIKVITN
jgi:hypothetical protein